MWGIYCLAEDLLASQEGLCSMELVSQIITFCFSCKKRPALNVTLVPDKPSLEENKDVAKLPGIHYLEMRKDVSRVGTKFGNWYLACT
jgi:hypothetical protein